MDESRERRLAAAQAPLIRRLVAIGMLAAAPAAALPICPGANQHAGYKIYLDGQIGEAMRPPAAAHAYVKALRPQLAADIERLKFCMATSGLSCPATPVPLPCITRIPGGSADFPPLEIAGLDNAKVVLETWMEIDADPDGNGIDVVRFTYLLVPFAGTTPAAPGIPASLTFERRLPATSKGQAVRDSLGQGIELKALTYLCSGVRRLTAKQYDDAYAHFNEALSTILDAPPVRRESLKAARGLAVRLAWETWERATQDDVNGSGIGATPRKTLVAALGPKP